MRSLLPIRSAMAWLLPGALLILGGCSAAVQTGTVSGTVTYNKNPVTAGTINFHHTTKGVASQSKLDGSGNFTLPGSLEVGTYKVYVLPPIPEQLPPGQPIPKTPVFNVPPKYQDLAQTPLSREVKAGPNTFAIDLE